MKSHLPHLFLIALACTCIVGCEPEPGGSSSPADNQSNSAAASSTEKSLQHWKLADGTSFACWVSGDCHATKPVWFWCDASTGPVSYRVAGGAQHGDWKPMKKIDVVGDDNRIVEDPNGQFGATELLPAGKYSVSYKIGSEEFSAVTLKVDD
jgi:hypothetical protein